ncbi:hypothetical protein BD779DRAFT_1671927 [Infundibulicybe gibba]|nr:hypothetical protein BD779DRAFT_1671927 [Infundibulicybe gibba]
MTTTQAAQMEGSGAGSGTEESEPETTFEDANLSEENTGDSDVDSRYGYDSDTYREFPGTPGGCQAMGLDASEGNQPSALPGPGGNSMVIQPQEHETSVDPSKELNPQPKLVSATSDDLSTTGTSGSRRNLITSNQNEFNLEALPTCRGRLRRTRDTTEIHACICGVVVAPSEIEDGTSVIQCAYRGCETSWFHLACLNFDYAPKGWRCENHMRPTKRSRIGQ